MEVESCHVSSGGISWPSVSVYRHKIFIYHLQHVLKMRYEAAEIAVSYSISDTHQRYFYYGTDLQIFISTLISLIRYFYCGFLEFE